MSKIAKSEILREKLFIQPKSLYVDIPRNVMYSCRQ